MKYLCIESIFNNGSTVSASVFSDSGKFQLQQFIDLDKAFFENEYYQNCTIVCFDSFKYMNFFSKNALFVYDVKTLYRLFGYKIDSLIDLGTALLGVDRLNRYVDLSNKIKYHLNSYSVCKIDYKKYSEDKLFPADLLAELYRERAKVIIELFLRFDEKDVMSFYNKFYDKLKTLFYISQNHILIDKEYIKNIDSFHVQTILKSIKEDNTIQLKFNPVGAKTGRLSFEKNSLNIYSLPKERVRQAIIAPDDFRLVQFDYKSFQPRLAIFSTDNETFKNKFRNVYDIYSIFDGDREKNKMGFLAWMFGVDNNLIEFDALPIRELRMNLYEQFLKLGKLINPFGRVLKYTREPVHSIFQNYITSLEVDCMLAVLQELEMKLEDKKSKIIFPFHDAIVFYISKHEVSLIKEIKYIMENTHTNMFGTKFPVDIKIGKNFGQMENMN